MSLTIDRVTLRRITEEFNSREHCSGNLKSRSGIVLLCYNNQ